MVAAFQHRAHAPATLVAVLLALVNAAKGSAELQAPPIRYWVDSFAFSQGETDLLLEAIQAPGSGSVLAGDTRTSFLTVKGWHAPEEWDVYWTTHMYCQRSLQDITSRGPRVSCIPGMEALTAKDGLVRTLGQAYGEAAWGIIPRSYLLPEQYWNWRAWVRRQGSGDSGMWALKENRHRGVGLQILPTRQAFLTAWEQRVRQPEEDEEDFSPGNKWLFAQQYVQDQMTVHGRPFYIRTWVLVTSISPLRVFLFDGGIVGFGNRRTSGASDPTAKLNSPPQISASHPPRLSSSESHSSTPESPSQPSVSDDISDETLDENPPSGRGEAPVGGTAELAAGGEVGGQAQQGDMIVNLWTQDRETAQPWSIAQLRAYFDEQTGGPAVFNGIWEGIRRAIGLTIAAGVGPSRTTAAEYPAPSGVGFELLGLDFIVGADGKPWLLEVNPLPSMARKVIDCEEGNAACFAEKARSNPFDEEKAACVRQIVALLNALAGARAVTSTGVPENSDGQPVGAEGTSGPADAATGVNADARPAKAESISGPEDTAEALGTDDDDSLVGKARAAVKTERGFDAHSASGRTPATCSANSGTCDDAPAPSEGKNQEARAGVEESGRECLTEADLLMVQETVAELRHAGRFTPLYPLPSAAQLNRQQVLAEQAAEEEAREALLVALRAARERRTLLPRSLTRLLERGWGYLSQVLQQTGVAAYARAAADWAESQGLVDLAVRAAEDTCELLQRRIVPRLAQCWSMVAAKAQEITNKLPPRQEVLNKVVAWVPAAGTLADMVLGISESGPSGLVTPSEGPPLLLQDALLAQFGTALEGCSAVGSGSGISEREPCVLYGGLSDAEVVRAVVKQVGLQLCRER